MTQVELAIACDMARTTLTGIENGKAFAGRIAQEKLAAYFNMPVAGLTGEIGDASLSANDLHIPDMGRVAELLRIFNQLQDDDQDRAIRLIYALAGSDPKGFLPS